MFVLARTQRDAEPQTITQHIHNHIARIRLVHICDMIHYDRMNRRAYLNLIKGVRVVTHTGENIVCIIQNSREACYKLPRRSQLRSRIGNLKHIRRIGMCRYHNLVILVGSLTNPRKVQAEAVHIEYTKTQIFKWNALRHL